MANETWKLVQAKGKQAMKQVLGQNNETVRMKVTPALAMASLAHGDDVRWNPNDNGIDFNPYKGTPQTSDTTDSQVISKL